MDRHPDHRRHHRAHELRAGFCAGVGAGPAVGGGAATTKRITAAILGDAPALVQRLTGFGQRGTDVVEDLVLSGLTITDNTGVLQPLLAEAVPSVENGLWQVLPDGRMITTWKIRPDARWHDGTPLTAQDLAFAAQVGMDPNVPEFGDVAFGFVDHVEVVDPQTITTYWKQPFIEADRMFGQRTFASPLPRHLLEQSYLDNPAGFTQGSYWNTDFVGTGPFKLKEFAPGSHIVFDAFDGYALGRPKIDVLEVRFFADPAAVVASMMAGTIDVTLGKTLSVEEALQVGDQGVRTEYTPSNAISIYPQLLTPSPPIIANVQFRRALLHAVNRQELADTLLAGRSSVAHSFMFPNQEQYRSIEANLPRYDYSPRKAAELIEGLGYSKGPDGFYRDAAGTVLEVELRASTTDINQKAMISVADTWQQTGVKVDPLVYSRQAAQDNEFIFTFPSFTVQRYVSDLDGLKNLPSSRTPLPENRFRPGNLSRYQSPELDALLDRYFVTVPRAERLQVLGQILYHLADQLPQLGLFYDVEPTVISSRVRNVTARWPTSTQAWNAYAWDVQ